MNDDEAKAAGLRMARASWWRRFPGVLMQFPERHGVVTQQVRPTCARVVDGDPIEWPPRCWPDLRDGATMGAALALWQARPGHVFRVPCPVLAYAAAYGLTDPRTIRALVDAMEAKP